MDFDRKTVPWLKDYLTRRGIQVTDQGRSKRKAELVELAGKAHEMKLQRIDEDDEEPTDVIASKLSTEKGTIPRLENIQSWSYDFSKMPPFTFADLYTLYVLNWLWGIHCREPQVIQVSAWVQVILRWSCSRLYDALCQGHELHFIQIQGLTNGEIQN